MIELIDFNKSYSSKKGTFSVKNVTLTISEGKITGLLGPNGSGKSTIMNCICGFLYPTSGKIFVSDKNGNKINIAENQDKAMNLIGYVPEISKLPPEFLVIDFLYYAANIHSIFEKEADEAVKKVITNCNLEKILNSKIKNLSKGQQQRVSFAQAIIHNPPNLILDEPISGLDPSQIKQMRTLIQNLSKTKSVLMSTHILSEVNNLCNNVYIMNNGIMTEIKNTNNLEKEYLKITEHEIE